MKRRTCQYQRLLGEDGLSNRIKNEIGADLPGLREPFQQKTKYRNCGDVGGPGRVSLKVNLDPVMTRRGQPNASLQIARLILFFSKFPFLNMFSHVILSLAPFYFIFCNSSLEFSKKKLQ
jgi:hypothetical protein